MSKTTKTNNQSLGRMKLLFFFFLVTLVLLILSTLPRLSIPLGIAYIASLILEPLIKKFKLFGLKRNLSIVIIFFILGFASIYPIVKIVPDIKDEAQKLEYYIPKIENYLRFNYSKIRINVNERFNVDIGDKYLGDLISYGNTSIKKLILNLPTFLGSLAEWLFIMPLFLFFILKDGRAFKNSLILVIPNSIFERFYFLIHQFHKQIGGYIFAKFIEASIVGLIIIIGLLFLDVKFFLILGLIAALTNIIPYLGPIVGSIPGVIFAIVEYGVSYNFYAVLLLYLIANVIDLAFVFPILVSKIVNLHPIIVVTSVILGSQYLGIIGMIVSIPLAAALKLILTEIYIYFYSPRSID